MKRKIIWLNLVLVTLLVFFITLAAVSGSKLLAQGRVTVPQNQRPEIAQQAGGVSTVAAGAIHSCVLLATGGVQCWGGNLSGQLGDGTTVSRSVPTNVVGLSSGIASISAGAGHTCALLSTGNLVCWGKNGAGQLGDGTTIDRASPVEVDGLSGVIGLAAGDFHTCAVLSTGTVHCWGGNNEGQLGNGTTTGSLTPVAVQGLSNAVAVTAGFHHTCAFLTTGAVKCWGNNSNGQLGSGTHIPSLIPVDVVGLGSDVVSISAKLEHTCALLATGHIKCWGENFSGQLGNGTFDDQPSPVSVTNLSTAVAVATGTKHTCAIMAAGTVKCWGDNDFAQLGNGTTSDSPIPVEVVGVSEATSLGVGNVHACVVTPIRVACWGDGSNAQLGFDPGITPQPVADLKNVTALTAGGRHSCAIASGGARCWGANDQGQLGDGTLTSRLAPVAVVGITGSTTVVKALDAGGGHTCARTLPVPSPGFPSSIKCWGDNSIGQLGNGTTSDSSIPVVVSSPGGSSNFDPVDVSVGNLHGCLRRSTLIAPAETGARCWGSNEQGQLGNDSLASGSTTPVTVAQLSDVKSVVAGGNQTCAVQNSGKVKCWGHNSTGQLGDNTVIDRRSPVEVIGLTGVMAISGGRLHTCSLLANGSVKCWGNNSSGQLGDGTTIERHTPVAVATIENAQAIAAGSEHTCALLDTGAVRCWGRNDKYQLGTGQSNLDPTPIAVEVVGLSSGVQDLAAGGNHTCALLDSGIVKCWGDNDFGQLGLGFSNLRNIPVDIAAYLPGRTFLPLVLK